MSKTPLDTFFNLPPREDNEEYRPEIYEILISENPDLDEVTKLALQAYKEQMENVQHVEPKYRQRYLEVAQQYLSLAMQSLSKVEELKLKKEKQEFELNKKSKDDDSSANDGKISRKALLEVVKNTK